MDFGYNIRIEPATTHIRDHRRHIYNLVDGINTHIIRINICLFAQSCGSPKESKHAVSLTLDIILVNSDKKTQIHQFPHPPNNIIKRGYSMRAMDDVQNTQPRQLKCDAYIYVWYLYNKCVLSVSGVCVCARRNQMVITHSDIFV